MIPKQKRGNLKLFTEKKGGNFKLFSEKKRGKILTEKNRLLPTQIVTALIKKMARLFINIYKFFYLIFTLGHLPPFPVLRNFSS